MVEVVLMSEVHVSDIKYEGLPRELVKEPSFAGWTFANEDANREIDYAKHLKRKFFDSRKRQVDKLVAYNFVTESESAMVALDQSAVWFCACHIYLNSVT